MPKPSKGLGQLGWLGSQLVTCCTGPSWLYYIFTNLTFSRLKQTAKMARTLTQDKSDRTIGFINEDVACIMFNFKIISIISSLMLEETPTPTRGDPPSSRWTRCSDNPGGHQSSSSARITSGKRCLIIKRPQKILQTFGERAFAKLCICKFLQQKCHFFKYPIPKNTRLLKIYRVGFGYC